MLQAACTLFKTSTYLPSRLNCVTKHNSKLPEYLCFTANAISLATLRMRAISFSETSAPTYLSILTIQEIREKSKHSIE